MEKKMNPNDIVEEFDNEDTTDLEEVILETEKTDGEVVDDDGDLEKKLAEMNDKCLRVAAEYYNYRERTTKEKANMYNDGARDTVEKLLPVIDNFERAVKAKRDSEMKDTDEGFFKGIEMIFKQLNEILTAMGVEEITTKGAKFDPKLHSAVSHVEDENFGENEITIEMMKGYTFKGKVIRHSMVQVAN